MAINVGAGELVREQEFLRLSALLAVQYSRHQGQIGLRVVMVVTIQMVYRQAIVLLHSSKSSHVVREGI